jgi:SPP1 family predicted phage head-tail adaptor
MATGRMNMRIRLEQPTAIARDVYGARTVVWKSAGDVWAELSYSARGQEMDGDRILTKAELVAKIHYRPEVLVDWRIVWDGYTYNLRNVDNTDRRRRFTTLYAVRGEPF